DTERNQIKHSLAALEGDETREAEIALIEHERLEQLRAEERRAEGVLTELGQRSSRAASQVAAAKAKLAGLERRTEEMTARQLKLTTELEGLAETHEELERHRAEHSGQVAELKDAREAAQERRSELERRLVALKQALLESEHALDAERASLAQQRGRLRALEEMRERLEGVGDGVKSLLSTGDPTLLGLVVDRIEAPPELSVSLASLLGGLLECVVVSDIEEAAVLLQELADQKQGRATIISSSPKRVAGKSSRPLAGPGVIGPLLDRLTFAPADEALVAALVGDAVLVENTSFALSLAPFAEGRTLVSLDGTIVHADGRVSGGSSDAVASGLVDEQREMRDLRELCAGLLVKVEEQIARHQGLRDEMNGIGGALDEARQTFHEAEIALVSAEKDEKRTAEKIGSVEQRLATVTSELEDIGQKLADGGHEQAQAESTLKEGEATLREAEAEAEGAMATAATWREQAAAQLSVVTDKKIRLARVREQVESIRGTVLRLGRSYEELMSRVSRLEKELDEISVQTGETSGLEVHTKEALTEAAVAAEEAESVLVEARRIFDEARTALGEREAGLKGLRTAQSEAAEKLAAEERTLERLVINREHLLGAIAEKFRGLDLMRVVGDYHLLPTPDQEHADRTSELTHLIDRMGPVNLDATREHAEEKERLVFYTEQKADLEKALDDLRRAIAQMNRESKRLFRETYDSINERFKVLFPKLFNGGRAELHLTNPEDLLETGVEIVAQPPGKKLGNIELMSGGEKALTAVSLIFAIFQHKPSPFCILDEVDAPLDEANVTRYNEMIREMTDRSQFILITHIKRTMQSVDVLYGVTMQEAGISRLVSVKVNESAQRRSALPSSETGAEQVQVA
ncbi:MAG TPA: chromosome segregation protein SMC, partial [Polyangiaceae bacterium]|nr:chromosome segregation protein SMC [Polyangiaceae bacterium]